MTSEFLCADLIKEIDWNDMPQDWHPDVENFGQRLHLWEYQQDALRAAIKLLYHYYDTTKKYELTETPEDNKVRKKDFFVDLQQLNPDIEKIGNVRQKDSLFDEMKTYFTEETVGSKQVLSFWNIVNKMGFWMATGSGKTYVMVKLIQILKKLSEKKLIPSNNILILTESDFLMDQIRTTIDKFNRNSPQKIKCLDLKDDFDTAGSRRSRPNEINVYMYKSGNIVGETKQIQLAYDQIENDGKWYVLLDEAHKGSSSSEEKKRQKYFAMISRNGYLFNFSATFTLDEDKRTTVFNYNLPKFLAAGYGKNLYLAQQQALSFRSQNDFQLKAKKKIVLQSLIYLVSICCYIQL